MKRYQVSGFIVELHTGILELTPEQAASRVGSLADLGEGLYSVLEPVQFKRGEEIGYDGDVNKDMAEKITVAPATRKAHKK
jgi:hypothetical protein